MTKPDKLYQRLLASTSRTISFRDFERLLRAFGFELDRTVGSHHQFVHPTRPGTVTVAYANGNEGKDLFGKTLDSIFRQAGWK